jgi:hypothetical protein
VTLTAVRIDEMQPAELAAFRSYAAEQLGILLRMVVNVPTDGTEDEEQPKVPSRNDRNRGSIFRRLSRRTPPTSSATSSGSGPSASSNPAAHSPSMTSLSPRRQSSDGSSGSDTSRLFGRPLAKVLEADRLQTGNPQLRVPIIVSSSLAYLQHQCNVPGHLPRLGRCPPHPAAQRGL